MILYRYSKEKFCLGHSRSRIKPTKKKETFRILFLCPKIFYVGFLLTPAVLCRVLILDFFFATFHTP